MKVILQRATQASVSINNRIVSRIHRGFLILIGFHKEDTEKKNNQLIKKILSLRLFSDEKNRQTQSIQDIQGDILIVSQFTLYADCKKGTRPNYSEAMPSQEAKVIYDAFISEFREQYPQVKTGKFGEMMEVSLINEGPFTLILDS
jgi:D-tyrosyl-tRNA(Tyr) deacylase